jgi:DNA repair photolyase
VLVLVSLATLDPALAARLEPGASSPALRLAAIRNLSRAGVWVGVNLSPLLPGVNDSEVDALADAAAQAGAHALCWQGRLADAASHFDMQARLAQLREAHGWAHELPALDTSQFRPPAAPVVEASAVQRQKSLF